MAVAQAAAQAVSHPPPPPGTVDHQQENDLYTLFYILIIPIVSGTFDFLKMSY